MTTVTGQSSLFARIKAEKRHGGVLTAPKAFVEALGPQAALMLSQMLYWTDRAKDGGWFHKTREQWGEELGLSIYHIRKALTMLSTARIVESKIEKWSYGTRPVYHVNTEAVEELLEGGRLEFSRGVGRRSTGGSAEVHPPYIYDRDYNRDYSCGQLPARTATELPSNPQEEDVNQYGRKTRKERTTIGPSSQKLDTLKKQQAADAAPVGKHVTAGSLADLWVKWVPHFNKKQVPFMAEMPYERKGLFRRCVIVWRAANQDPNAVLKAICMDWIGFVKHVQALQGLKLVPTAPSVEFTVRWANEAIAFYMKSGEKKLEAVIAMKEPVPLSAVNCMVVEIKETSKVATLEEILQAMKENDEEHVQREAAGPAVAREAHP